MCAQRWHALGFRLAAVMATGLLQRVQEIKASAEPKVLESIARINNCFPEDAVKFSDPLYAKELLNRLDE